MSKARSLANRANENEISFCIGAAGDGVTDDTAAISALFNSAGPVYLGGAGTYLIDVITIAVKCDIVIGSGVTLITKSAASVTTTPTITLSAAGSSFESFGVLDANSSGRSLMIVTADDCIVRLHRTINVTFNGSSTNYVSALEINSANRFKGSVRGWNSAIPAGSGSTPRILTVQGTSTDFVIEEVVGVNCWGGVCVGTATIGGYIGKILMDNAGDNGLYQLQTPTAGAVGLDVGALVYTGNDEPAVLEGPTRIGEITVIGKSGCGFDCQGQNAVPFDVHVGILRLQQGATVNDSAACVFKTRNATGNKIGNIRIGEVWGKLTGSTCIYITSVNDSVESFSIGGGEITYVYDTVRTGSLNAWMDLTGCKQFNIRNLKVVFVDSTSALTNVTQVAITLPTTNLARPSFWENNRFFLLNNDLVAQCGADFRIYNLAQALVWSSQVVFQDIAATIYGREINISAAGSADGNLILGSAAPSGGTWRQGTDLAMGGKTAAPFRCRCTVAGTPGTWVTY
jgi:hypothetical protein